jgi:hypothetical protein
MSVKITFTKELSIDLNAYYPNFPKKLREAINAEIMGKLSGDKPQAPTTRVWRGTPGGGILADDARLFVLGSREPSKGRTRALYATIRARWGYGTPFLGADLKELLLGAGIPPTLMSTTINNLWRTQAIDITE